MAINVCNSCSHRRGCSIHWTFCHKFHLPIVLCTLGVSLKILLRSMKCLLCRHYGKNSLWRVLTLMNSKGIHIMTTALSFHGEAISCAERHISFGEFAKQTHRQTSNFYSHSGTGKNDSELSNRMPSAW